MSIVEEQYYKTKAEIRARLFEILRLAENQKGYITDEEDELALDAAAGIEHAAEMALFAFEEAEKAIDAEMRKMFVRLQDETKTLKGF